ncbi:hypothetical protein SADUNF_Sadunf15G0007200 [Salix dunnii]|uniref:EF-hand domain-containing protein n=1 Tax=Salix dunnii TaxID=1413687 RepID=A0A835JBH0_9ROSI|nr:hypothetical protein SADUNF_Sadunf15G0007200 [Salix dunnii]
MEEMHQTSFTYYENLSSQNKQLVSDFFNSMDVDGDGRNISEYTKLLEKKGYASWFTDHNLFQSLDKDGDGSLDFNEILTDAIFVDKYTLVTMKRPEENSANNEDTKKAWDSLCSQILYGGWSLLSWLICNIVASVSACGCGFRVGSSFLMEMVSFRHLM